MESMKDVMNKFKASNIKDKESTTPKESDI
jgi:hypothetical protein